MEATTEKRFCLFYSLKYPLCPMSGTEQVLDVCALNKMDLHTHTRNTAVVWGLICTDNLPLRESLTRSMLAVPMRKSVLLVRIRPCASMIKVST